jgi:serine/threonine-protein kinase SRPK3
MNGSDIKKAAIEKAKAKVSQAQQAVNGNNSTKKKRKGDQLKPIITTEPSSPASSPLHHTAPHMKPAYANQLSRSPSTSSDEEDGASVQDEEDTEGELIPLY